MDTNTTPAKTKKSFAEKFQITKQKVLFSLMASGAVLVMLIASAYASFFHIADRMSFSFWDFAPLYTGISLLIFLVCFVSMILCKGTAHRVLFALYSGVALVGGVQNMITTFTFKGMPGDGTVARATAFMQIANFGMWIALIAIVFWFVVLSKQKDFARTVVALGLLFVMVTQSGTAVIEGINYSSIKQEKAAANAENGYQSNQAYLTTLNMFEVSDQKNVIVFVLDRFDTTYFERFMETDSEYLEALDGFTFYNDNVAKYPRTFPAVTSMLTGTEYDYTADRESYMEDAYGNSPLLQDLIANNYKINLYMPITDGYKNATAFDGMVTNSSDSTGYDVSKTELTSGIFSLASYFWAPELVKARLQISESYLNNMVTLLGDYPQYSITNTSDAEHYAQFKEQGITTQSEQNSFTYLHLRGCHAPFTIDENMNVTSEEGTYAYEDVVKQTEGMFKFISEYLQQLKDLGLYEDATIIITGDHAALETDSRPYEEDTSKAKLTALLVKESGQSGTPLRTSTAQVSQDNLIPTIIKSAGIETERFYGKAYSEINEGDTTTRTHYFSTLGQTPNKVWKYTITGPAKDFNNWKREQIQ